MSLTDWRLLTMLLAQGVLFAWFAVAHRERKRQERALGFEEPPPYAWPKPERPVVTVRQTPAGIALLATSGVLMLVTGVLIVVEIASG